MTTESAALRDLLNHQRPLPARIPHVIGLSGYARSGKDTVAGVLRDLYGFKRVAFADNLKQFTRAIDPIVFMQDKDPVRADEWVRGVGDTDAKNHPEYRRLLQEVGTKARIFFGEDIWVRSVMKNLEPEIYYAISDVRFKNEANAIREIGGQVWRIQRPGVGPTNDHVSEHDLDHYDFDYVIQNDGTVTDLEGDVQYFLGEFQ